MIRAGTLTIPQGIEDLCNPSRTALLIYDMQAGITGQIADGSLIVARCAAALSVARAAGMRVVFTRHQSAPKSWMGVTQYRTAMAWQHTDDPLAVRPWFLRDADSFRIVAELEPRSDELVFDKLAMSAFEGTPLAFVLRDCGITGLVIAGIALEIGIEPTARHATDIGIVPIILQDACGAGDPDAAGRAIATLRFIGEAVISDVDSFSQRLRARPSAQ